MNAHDRLMQRRVLRHRKRRTGRAYMARKQAALGHSMRSAYAHKTDRSVRRALDRAIASAVAKARAQVGAPMPKTDAELALALGITKELEVAE